MVSLHSHISTMMEKCLEIHAKRCENWNYEGQWLLNSTTRSVLGSGKMCNKLTAISSEKEQILQQWFKLWDLNKAYLVEKSPHLMVKTRFMKEILGKHSNVKFLVVMKHPLTVNVATPRASGWKYYRDVVGSSRSNDLKRREAIPWSQVRANTAYFQQFIDHNETHHRNCSLGWLQAHQALAADLRILSSQNVPVGILRYERFAEPLPVCKSIFRFMFSSSSIKQHEYSEWLCGKLFSNSRNPETAYSSLNNKNKARTIRRLIAINNSDSRQLRLRGEDTGIRKFQFRKELVLKEGTKRIKDFQYSLRYLSTASRKKLEELSARTQVFGYSFNKLLPIYPNELEKYELPVVS